MICMVDGLGSLMNWSHHCRRCGKTVCSKCGTNKRYLSKKDKKNLYRICDQCDTILSNFKLKQTVDSNIQAQRDQIEIIDFTLQQTQDRLNELKGVNDGLGEKNDKKLQQKWEKRKNMDEEIQRLVRDVDILANTKNNLATAIANDSKILQEQLEEKKKLNAKKQ
mmetsp:Transcript_27832/g.26887  ORF Transcript_27832/g.26887 Transcript_27832/m.26887 type:complete len:165 (-) Transcript_27832:503-997(-)